MDNDASLGTNDQNSLDDIYTNFVAGAKFGMIVALLTYFVSSWRN